MLNSRAQPTTAMTATIRRMFTNNSWVWLAKAVTTPMAGHYGSLITTP